MSIQSENEGTLYKWTNYWGGKYFDKDWRLTKLSCDLLFPGWQPRWVVLQKGILSYYNSSDEVGKGCRASIKITASDIIGKLAFVQCFCFSIN